MNKQFLSINTKLAQVNKLSPSSIQYLKLLQLSQVDLLEYIADELVSNPLLEDGSEDTLSTKELGDFLQSLSPPAGLPLDRDSENPIENSLESPVSLYDHLSLQLDMMNLDSNKLTMSKIIVNSLNRSGYLDSSLSELSSTFNFKLDDLQDCLSIVQGLEPSGVGATSLSECLTLQLDRNDNDFSLLFSIISNHLELVASNKLQTLSKKMQLPMKKLNILIQKISRLNPKPGLSYGQGDELPTNYIVPDVFVSIEGDELSISLPESLFPRLRINSYYKSLLKSNGHEDSKEFLTKNLNRAIMIIKNLEQRNQTLRSVAEEIVFFQRDFFLGRSSLRPLNLRQVASRIEVHESTVSRAIKNKYLHCPSGLFSLKHFFSNKSTSASLEDKGSLDIKALLGEIIALEDPYNPYSDSMLSTLLSERGLAVARRTVTKYREALKIESSRLRKKYK